MNADKPLMTRFSSPEATSRFATILAEHLRPGDTVLLYGDLGSGKTHLARAIIQARLTKAGLAEDVPSPTYTLVQVYDDGASEIWHADLYRLSGPDEIAEIGLLDAFDSAICLIEWPDRLEELAPDSALSITLAMSPERGMRDAEFASKSTRLLEAVANSLAELGDV